MTLGAASSCLLYEAALRKYLIKDGFEESHGVNCLLHWS